MEDQEQDQQYINGFNNGYLLAKYEPTLAAQLATHQNPHSEYFNGLINGKQEYDREMRDWARSFSKGQSAKDDRDIDRDRDR